MRDWLALFRPGDLLLILIALAILGWLIPSTWQGGLADRVIVRAGGVVHAELDLRQRRTLEVPGPLGITRIVIEPGRARVVSDPGVRQYCVRQGWLSRPGEVALCAPNQVSLQIAGRTRAYDSLSY